MTGTPWGITIDGQTLEDGSVTLQRVGEERVAEWIRQRLAE